MSGPETQGKSFFGELQFEANKYPSVMARFPVKIVVVLLAIVGSKSSSRVSTQISKRSMGYTFVSDVMT